MNKLNSILIVEDEKIVREGLVRAFSREYKTYQASNGKEAIDIINKNREIKVVVSDLKMPAVDGFELLDKIQDLTSDVSVIFVSAFFSVEAAVDAMKMGAFDYMTKPVDLKKLEKTIKNAIEGTKG
jgi:DNA-binding NtrC family response regulator